MSTTICRLKRIIIIIVYGVIVFVSVNGYEPDFLFPLENVTIAQGRDAIFTCVVNNIGGNRVSAPPEGDFAPARVRISNYDEKTKKTNK